MTERLQTEAQLIRRLQAKQAPAFTTLYNTYYGALFSVMVKLVNDHEKAEDLLQDAFLKAWLHIHQYDPAQGRLYTWLLTITRRVALDELRHRQVHRQAITYMFERSTEWTPPAFHDELINGSLFALLPPNYRPIMELLYRQGLTQLEISQELALPVGTVKTRGRMALQALKHLLSQDIGYYHRERGYV